MMIIRAAGGVRTSDLNQNTETPRGARGREEEEEERLCFTFTATVQLNSDGHCVRLVVNTPRDSET